MNDYDTFCWLLPLDVHNEINLYCRTGVNRNFKLIEVRDVTSYYNNPQFKCWNGFQQVALFNKTLCSNKNGSWEPILVDAHIRAFYLSYNTCECFALTKLGWLIFDDKWNLKAYYRSFAARGVTLFAPQSDGNLIGIVYGYRLIRTTTKEAIWPQNDVPQHSIISSKVSATSLTVDRKDQIIVVTNAGVRLYKIYNGKFCLIGYRKMGFKKGTKVHVDEHGVLRVHYIIKRKLYVFQ